MTLSDLRTLGRSGLAVSPLALGCMTFGAKRWGSGERGSREVFNAYVEAGGNFVDTADVYSAGRSEEMLGGFIAERGLRDRLVVGTKAGFPRSGEGPLAGGNGSKNIRLGLEGSLRRLRTDYVDLFWVHVWDQVTPAEEVLQTLTDALRAGKVLHYGFSNAPGWYVAKIATLAHSHGLPAPIGLQYLYSLIDRGVELDIVPAGREFGLGLVPWSPLGAGLLTGKYGRDKLAEAGGAGSLPNQSSGSDAEAQNDGRLNGDNPFGGMLFTERNFDIVDAVRLVADELDRSMAEVALAWVAQKAGVASVLIGASRAEQVHANVASLNIIFTPDQRTRLDAISMPPTLNPYFIFDLPRAGIFNGAQVEPWR